uniref:Uncharacterized protein n=1 Tax=Anopheles arabiensis TaxID=7173 RepID=A0A182IGX3_ANOAR
MRVVHSCAIRVFLQSVKRLLYQLANVVNNSVKVFFSPRHAE